MALSQLRLATTRLSLFVSHSLNLSFSLAQFLSLVALLSPPFGLVSVALRITPGTCLTHNYFGPVALFPLSARLRRVPLCPLVLLDAPAAATASHSF